MLLQSWKTVLMARSTKKMFMMASLKLLWKPESFNINISHQLFDYKITSVNSQRENPNSKGGYVLKKPFETFILKISGIQT